MIGITDFGSAFDLKYKLSNAVRAGTRVVSTQNTSDVTNAIPPSVTAVRARNTVNVAPVVEILKIVPPPCAPLLAHIP